MYTAVLQLSHGAVVSPYRLLHHRSDHLMIMSHAYGAALGRTEDSTEKTQQAGRRWEEVGGGRRRGEEAGS
ncbi:hypothetical protein EYF80_051591 [Liparis tanakae]|uniref:Uncharacterized protein n=1 Tax=Liparis tanakae TaxID=230148 RepID=A0A4Z2FBH0_9TELE|nr:hypothetical protein EYF80_051591 [Liparis tanakae]